jgi:hypothetical protein
LKIEGKLLRAFPDELLADQINTKIDELFVPLTANKLPGSSAEFQSWRTQKLGELRRLSFRCVRRSSIRDWRQVQRGRPKAGC